MALGNEWLAKFLEYDFDDAYFNDVNCTDIDEDNDNDWSNLECDSEDEVDFDFANPIVGEMFAYLQRHYDIQPMRTGILIGHGYMEELNKGNPLKCYEMFCKTRPLPLHLVDELSHHGYLRDGQGDVNAT